MSKLIQFHIAAEQCENLQIRHEWPPGFRDKISFAVPYWIECELANFVNQSITGRDYQLEIRCLSVKSNCDATLLIKRPCLSVVLMLEGRLEGELTSKIDFSLSAKSYSVFYLPAGKQQLKFGKGEYRWICIIPPIAYFKKLATEHHAMSQMLSRLKTKNSEADCLDAEKVLPVLVRSYKRLQQSNKEGPALDLEIRRYIVEILESYSEQARNKSHQRIQSPNTEDKANAVKDYILANLGSQQLGGLNELSIRFHITTRTLTRAFKRLTGKTIPQFIGDERMEWARQLLEKRELPVYEIAWMVGYSDTANFNRKFKKKFGYPPLNRKRKR